MAKVLVADDEHAICEVFAQILADEGHTPLIASTGEQAIRAVETHLPSVVFMDVQMPNKTGLEALLEIHASHPEIPVILMTARGTVQIAMEAMASGAFDYLGKPIELPALRQLLERALHHRESDRADAETGAPPQLAPAGQPLGKGPAMQQIFKMMGLLTSNDMTVLITGESGSGKELIARGIHTNGRRRDKPFVAVNCAAIPEQLLESELFGHEKGAFTGAVERRIGRFEAAADGTLFLDEISELPYSLQSKLLRVLQEKTFERVGSDRHITLNARIVAASNRRLDEPNAANPFREDLYHRLNLVHLKLPALRDRKEDIEALALHFLAMANAELGKDLLGIEVEAMAALESFDWPGNVRELEHTIKRSVLTAPGPRLTVHDLVMDTHDSSRARGNANPFDQLSEAVARAFAEIVTHAASTPDAAPYQQVVEHVEHELVQQALQMTDGNQVAASALLGINRTTLRKKLQR